MIYLVDSVGKEAGLHLYNTMFYDNFKIAGKDVKVISNYTDGHTNRLFYNFYHGNKLIMVFLFLLSIGKLYMFSIKHRKDTFVYQSYGLRKIDQFFILSIRANNKYVLVHDVFDIKDVDKSTITKYKKTAFYRKHISQIICHSDKAEQTLLEIGYNGKIVKFPHFRYNYDDQVKNYHACNVGEDVKKSLLRDKTNLLFFGQLRETKGIDVLIEAIRHLQNVENLNIIVAGTDKEHLIKGDVPDKAHFILRYMNDDEMVFLYSHCDYVLLPYKEVYQSGVMESMLYFKKPGIMSDVEYFANIGREYPSFGIFYSPNTGEQLASVIRNIAEGKNLKDKYYQEEDIQKYNEVHNVTKIISKEF